MTESAHPVPDEAYDVVVIGGGPASASTGALTAEHGHRTLILERSEVPRFHVGESLIPETYWTLKRLGLIERLQESAYPRKYSVQFFSEGLKPSAPFYFDEYKDCESSQTWQVWRDTFDQMLLERAVELGATVHAKAQVIEAHFDGDRATGVRVKVAGPNGERVEKDISCKVLVDATGQSAFLASRLGLKDTDPALKKGTVWTYFEDARRDPGRDEGATLIMQTADKQSWFWFIPLPGNVTSIGCTADMDVLFAGGSTGEESFNRELERCPAMVERLAGATRVRDYMTTKDYTYYSRQGAGPGWTLVGDAYGFIDPVYSSGVFLALKSAEFAADAIHEAFQKNDFSAEQLGSWLDEHARGVDVFRKLVYAFYNPNFSFGRFLKMHPEFRSHVTDILIGDIFKDEIDALWPLLAEPAASAPEPAVTSK